MQLEKSYEILCKAFNDEAKTILEVKHQPWALLDWFSECLDRSCFNVFIIYPSHSTLESSSQKRTMLFLTLVCCLQDREDELDQLDKDGSSY